MHVYLNNRVVPKSEAHISVYDHGFLYGDGVYETMRSYDGVIFMLDEHLRRLYRSAEMISLSIFGHSERPATFDDLKNAIYDTLLANKLKDAYIRLTVSRGFGPIGLDPELCPKPTLVIMAEELKPYPRVMYAQGIKTVIATTRRNLKEALNPQIKSLNFLNNILAKIEAIKAGAYEAIMLNSKGHIAEGTISNIFFVKGDTLYTPSLDCGILDGITRSIVLEIANKESLKAVEGEFQKEDLYSADEVFISNTTMEIMPVGQIDNHSLKVGPVTKLLHNAYKKQVEAYVAEAKEKGPSLWGFSD